MVRTRACDIFGIDLPIVQAPLGGKWVSQGAALTAAVCDAGGLGSVPTAMRSPDAVLGDLYQVRELTDGPFAVNMANFPFDEDLFEVVMERPPAVFSMSLGQPRADVIQRVHEREASFVQQVTSAEQAERAAEAGADVICAQGGEAGGYTGDVSTMALVPQVARAVAPIPVLASGGIADGAGLAAALALGAEGVSIGTRFLASAECAIPDDWKRAILAAHSEDAVKVIFAEHFLPTAEHDGTPTVPRSLRTPFIDRWNAHPAEARNAGEALREQLDQAVADGTAHRLLPIAGQSAGLIDAIKPAGLIVRDIAAEAEAALSRASLALAGHA
jgi:nitronate monooxygenase/enoyl-[acyl-carrier protein] reductase II